MRKSKSKAPAAKADPLFDRIVTILEQARGNVVRAVNTHMVLAYWLIGREIVLDHQGGKKRAEYGTRVLSDLSTRLAHQYGDGFSVPNLQNFRKFYLAYRTRVIDGNIQYPSGTKSSHAPISRPEGGAVMSGFFAQLTWSHYRALMRVKDPNEREFYEQEAAGCGWSKDQIERQIQTSYYKRIVANRGPDGLVAASRDRLQGTPVNAGEILKAPYVLEFLGLPDTKNLHESALEDAIINNLQAFLLELGKGFSLVARQKHIRFDNDDFYVDLVFYNYILKCFLLIDLKMGKLTHQDVGQMDGYVRLYEDRFKVPGDNPTIGLILCADKSEAVAKYSVLSEGRRIFASKYLQFLPSEQELSLEIAKEHRLVEDAMRERGNSLQQMRDVIGRKTRS